MNWEKIFIIILTAIFINNIIFSRIIGLLAFFEETRKIKSVFIIGISTTIIMTLSSSLTWVTDMYLLKPFGAEYMDIIAYTVIILTSTYLVKLLLSRTRLKEHFKGMDIVVIANSAVLGIILINMQEKFTFTENLISSIASGIGYLMALLISAGINERLEEVDVPEVFRGVPISMAAMGIVAMIFMGFFGIN